MTKYDLAISFAGEQRVLAESLACLSKRRMGVTEEIRPKWQTRFVFTAIIIGAALLAASSPATVDAAPVDDDAVASAGDDDDPPAPRPAKKPAAQKPPAGGAKPRPKSGASPAVARRSPKLTPLKAKPGYIIGRAVFADGRPMPKFRVTALGWAGEIHLGPAGTVPSLGMVEGHRGRYQLQPTSA